MCQFRFVSVLASSVFVFLLPALHTQLFAGGINGPDSVGTVQAQQPSAQQLPVQQAPAQGEQAPVQGTAASPEIITAVTLESVQRIIQGLGFDCSRIKGSNSQADVLTFMGEGYKIVARVPLSNFIQLVIIFPNKGVSLEAVNTWNLSHVFNKASLTDNKKTLFLQTEIIVSGGVTKANIEDQIKEFRDSVTKWARFVLDNSAPTP